jgi:beta-glucosidase
MNQNNFPVDFIWGSATSSYQIEGGWNKGGKGPSIWDAFCQIPGKIHNNESGQIACDHYNRMEEDVALMKDLGLKAYRFSISWPRIQPTGKGKVNMAGIEFYSKLIDALLKNDIEPWVTLYHWDLPLALQFEDDGWTGEAISDYFAKYADICFEHFGDRVKNWITINEPWVVAMLGYGQGVFAPGRTSNTEPYLAGHNLIKAHAKAVDIYRKKYQAAQKGKIGITNNGDWREPLTDKEEDKLAAERALEFFLAWFADPIYKGKYPDTMINRLGDRLPKFSSEEIEIIKGSSDFFGLNHYTTMYAADSGGQIADQTTYGNGGLSEDQDVNLSVDPEWKKTSMQWSIVPWGCRKLLEWIDQRYDHPEIIITENGCAFDDEEINGKVEDTGRVDFYKSYLGECHNAIKNGVNLKGYFAWSLFDNFEWASGYNKRFGIIYVNFETQKRTPKASALWYSKVIKNEGFLG